MDNKSQWFHWKERFPEECCLKNVKTETSKNVYTRKGSWSYKFNLDLSLKIGDQLSRSSHGFYQMNLVWDLASTNLPSDVFLHKLKLENCAIKISMDSSDGEEQFSKWLRLDSPGDEKFCSWQTFIPKGKCGQLMLNKENKKRSVSWEVTVFGKLGIIMRAIDITIERRIIAHLNQDLKAFDNVSVFHTKSVPCFCGFGSGASTVILAIDEMPEETVVANKFLLAAYSSVFRKMLFETNMEEKASGRIILNDTSFLALKTFIGLISGDKVTGRDILEMSTDDTFKVLALAHKYEIEGIIDWCVMILMALADSEMGIADARRLFQAGKLYGIPDLCTRSFDWIRLSSVDPTEWDEIIGFPGERGN